MNDKWHDKIFQYITIFFCSLQQISILRYVISELSSSICPFMDTKFIIVDRDEPYIFDYMLMLNFLA